MPARGGVTCEEVLRCKNINCKEWRYKATAEQKGETHCICGSPFHRTEYRPVRGSDRAASRGQAQAKAKAKPGAKAKAYPKAQAARDAAGPRTQGQEPPWRKTREGSRTRSLTGGRSGVRRAASGSSAVEGHALRVDARRVKDPVCKWDVLASVARDFGDDALLEQAETSKQQALKAKADAMPPNQRVEHLRYRLRQAEEELVRRNNTVESTEIEIDGLQARLKIEVEERDTQEDVARELKLELQHAEDQLITQAEQKPVGRQVRSGNDGLVMLLKEVKAHLTRTAGGSHGDRGTSPGVRGGQTSCGGPGGCGPQDGPQRPEPGVRQHRGRQARQR